MFCFVAFAVLAVMGIFSSTHRVLAKEAFACIGRRVTLRPCDTGFRERLQGQMVGVLMRRSVRVARLVNRHFELLAWVFFILTVWSLVVSVQGAYNFYVYGSCDGLNASSFCVLDPTGSNIATSQIDIPDDVFLPSCSDADADTGTGFLSHIPLTLNNYPTSGGGVANQVIFIGCYECRYTRATYPTIQRLLEQYDTEFTFVHHPTRPSTAYLTAMTQCVYEASAADEWLPVIDTFMTVDPAVLADEMVVYSLLAERGYDPAAIADCVAAPERDQAVQQQRQEVINTGIYGTPLIFVNDTAVVGPKPYRVYRFMME